MSNGQGRCPRCGGVHGTESENFLIGAVGAAGAVGAVGAAGAALGLLGPAAAVAGLAALISMREARRIIESRKRSDEENRQLMAYIIDKCSNEEVKEWLKGHFQELVILPLVDMYKFLIEELEKKKEIDRTDIDIIFVAHGGIDSSMIPADCLMPLPSITDVVLYSPWNCAINANVAYGVATGSIQPHHRSFFCRPPPPQQPQRRCPHPDIVHQPTKLPNRWNSMKKAGGSRIPNIRLSPLKEPQDGAWNRVVFLQDILGEPGRNRVLIPFTRQGWMGSHKNIPFLIVTLVLSVVLEAFDYRATVHLCACLCRCVRETLDEAALKRQYAYTIDNTGMTSSEERIRNVHKALYRAFEDMFG